MEPGRNLTPPISRANWKTRLERSLLPVAFRSRAYQPLRYLNRRKAVILTYHGFTDERVHAGIQNHERKHVHVEDFRAQVLFLKEHYQVLPLAELVQRLTTDAPLPDRTAVITMDDGYRSTYRLAYPVLREFQVPAVVFLATDYVDNKRFLWTDRVEFALDRAAAGNYDVRLGDRTVPLPLSDATSRIQADRIVRSTLKAAPQDLREEAVNRLETAVDRRLDAATADPIYQPIEWSEAVDAVSSGVMAMGSHTHTHAILSRCQTSAIEVELGRSKEIIEHRLQRRCELFCYPNGRRGDFDDRTRELVRAAGYRCALTTVHGMNDRSADIYTLKRYPVTGRMLHGELAVRLSGLVELPASIGAFRGSRRHG